MGNILKQQQASPRTALPPSIFESRRPLLLIALSLGSAACGGAIEESAVSQNAGTTLRPLQTLGVARAVTPQGPLDMPKWEPQGGNNGETVSQQREHTGYQNKPNTTWWGHAGHDWLYVIDFGKGKQAQGVGEVEVNWVNEGKGLRWYQSPHPYTVEYAQTWNGRFDGWKGTRAMSLPIASPTTKHRQSARFDPFNARYVAFKFPKSTRKDHSGLWVWEFFVRGVQVGSASKTETPDEPSTETPKAPQEPDSDSDPEPRPSPEPDSSPEPDGPINIPEKNIRQVPLWGLFETTIVNPTQYPTGTNLFRDVELVAVFKHQDSGETIPFWGFFDGNGTGRLNNGGERDGKIWKLRFMPHKKGRWTFTWKFEGPLEHKVTEGVGAFEAVQENARPGVLKPLKSNFHWLQTPDGKPFLPRVWYTMVSELPYRARDFAKAYYDKAAREGYNMFVLNMLPINDWTTHDTSALPSDTPKQLNWRLWLDDKSKAYGFDTDRMNLFAWNRVEEHIQYLADRNIAVYPFQGFAIKRTVPSALRPDKFSEKKAKWYLKYSMARLAPFWNMIWNYTWEVDPGRDRTDQFGRWIDQYDPWDHMYTTQSLNSGDRSSLDDFSGAMYDMSTIEVGSSGPYPGNTDSVAHYYKFKKPIFMVEDYRPLWTENGQDDTEALDKAWRLICNGSFFAWSELDYNDWPKEPWKEVFTRKMARYIKILYRFIGSTNFGALKPRRDLVTNGAYALANPGREYVIFAPYIESTQVRNFEVNLKAGTYEGVWLNPLNDRRTSAGRVSGAGRVSFRTPAAQPYTLHLRRISGNEPPEDTAPPADERPQDNDKPEDGDPPPHGVLFEDDFSGDLRKWSVVEGSPRIENGQLVLETRSNKALEIELRNASELRDFSIQMDIRVEAFQWGLFSVHFRKAGRPFYQFSVEKYNADGSVRDTPTRLRVFKNEEEPAFKTVRQEFPTEQTKRLRIDVRKNTFVVHLDGQYILQYEAHDMQPQGTIAFRLYKAKWIIDNFRVTPFPN